jgi:hypothetical protein
VTDPRALAILFEKTEAELQRTQHPDPYRRQSTFTFSLPLVPSALFSLQLAFSHTLCYALLFRSSQSENDYTDYLSSPSTPLA